MSCGGAWWGRGRGCGRGDDSGGRLTWDCVMVVGASFLRYGAFVSVYSAGVVPSPRFVTSFHAPPDDEGGSTCRRALPSHPWFGSRGRNDHAAQTYSGATCTNDLHGARDGPYIPCFKAANSPYPRISSRTLVAARRRPRTPGSSVFLDWLTPLRIHR